MCRIPWNSWCAEFSGSCKAVSSRGKTRSQLAPSHCSSVLACLLPTQSITLFFFFFFLLPEKDVKLEKNKLDSGGLRDCFLCRTHTHLCCLYKQRLQRLTDLTTIHRKLRGLTVSPGILWSRWKSAMTATLSCSPQCIHSCRLQMYFPWQNTNTHTHQKRRAKKCCNNACHFNFLCLICMLRDFIPGRTIAAKKQIIMDAITV